jgi:outer membrane protein TolC
MKQNEIRNEVQSTLNDLKSVRQTVDFSYNVLMPQTENSLKSTQYNYETGMTSMLDLLDSYESYQEARQMFYESVNMYLKTIIELEKLTGMNFKTPQ